MSFKIIVPAKCIWAGEHVIINRGFAIVSPFKSYSLSLSYTQDRVKIANTISGEGFNSIPIYLWAIVRRALELVNRNPLEATGIFNIKNNIVVGSGLGFSAALCFSVAQWAVYYGLIPREELFEFAVKLEDTFHIKSSGVDIAGVMSKDVIKYTKDREITPIDYKWKPLLYISSSGEKSITEHCVKIVNQFRENDPYKAEEVDDQMIESSTQVLEALQSIQEKGFSLLKSALNLGNECFYRWGLVSEKLNEHIQELRKYTVACKIIGAGYGGHVISLWQEEPPKDTPFTLVKLMG